MPDIFSYDLIRALALPGCALCRALEEDDRRWMDSFWREGKQSPQARRRFFEAGGFCRDHAWLLHHLVSEERSGAAIADLYGQLATYDLRSLESLRENLKRRRRRREPILRRRRRCPACAFRADALERKAHFLVEALSEEDEMRTRYRRSEGLCFPHLARTLEDALDTGDEQTAAFLLDVWRDRLVQLRSGLAEYDRKRDYRYASEPKGAEQHSWTEVIRSYVGEHLS